MTPIFQAQAPVRLDFAGGWTDVPPFSGREGGVVVTAAIRLFAHAEVLPGGDHYRLVAEELGDRVEVDRDGLAADGRLDLLKAGLRMLPLASCALTTRSEAPAGSGLGSSGALDVALVGALSLARGEPAAPRSVADRACHLEAIEAGIPGGRQDQFAAAFGGFLRLDFRDPEATVETLRLDEAFARELERRTVLCYTGASRFSGATIARVMDAYERGDRAVCAALHGIRRAAEFMAAALCTGDLARVGQLLTDNWRHQQGLDGRMCTVDMARLEQAMLDAGALGGKAAGSGAGGSMFFLGPDDPGPMRQAARAMGIRLLPVEWSAEGVRAW